MSGHPRVLYPFVFSRKFPSSTIIRIFMVLLPLLLSLAACGEANTGGKIQLKMWYWDGAIDDKVVSQVNAHFPNIHLTAEKFIDSDNKIRTAMAAHTEVPDIIGLRGDDGIAAYFPDEDQFYDMRTLGASSVASDYLPWKWQLGIAPDGRMISFPMDTGPTALFYRADIFAQAGLPSDPQQVSDKIKTWDDYLQAAQQIKTATQGKSLMLDNITTIFTQMIAQSPQQYFDEATGKYIGDQLYMKQMWNEAVKAHEMKLTAKIPLWTQGWAPGLSHGLIASFVGAVWMKDALIQGAPDTAGKWRVAMAPGGAGNSGGSGLGISQGSLHPKEALQVIEWMQSPQNQLLAYKDIGLYPSAIAALDDPSISQPEPFFGGQKTTQIFATAAKEVKPRYIGPNFGAANNGFDDMLNLVEFQDKNPEQAWAEAQTETQRALLR